MIHAVHPAGEQAAAEGHLQFVAILRRRRLDLVREGGINGFAIDARDAGNVFRRLEPALDFETGDTQLHEARDFLHRGKILRAEKIASVAEIAGFAIHHQLIGHSTGLRAFAAIRAALAEALAGEALPGIGHAERAVDEDFQRHRLLPELLQLPQTALPREHRAVETEAVHHGQAFRRSDRHLCARVDFQTRCHPAREHNEPHVLHDDRIHSRRLQQTQLLLRIREFAGEDECVHGHESAHAVRMKKLHQLRQLLLREVVSAQPGIEARQSEVDRVRTVSHRGAGTLHVPGGREEFWAKWGRGHAPACPRRRRAASCHCRFPGARSVPFLALSDCVPERSLHHILFRDHSAAAVGDSAFHDTSAGAKDGAAAQEKQTGFQHGALIPVSMIESTPA